MGAVEVRRRAAWRFVRAIVRSQAGGVVGAVLSGLLWQTGAIAAPLIVSYTIDHGIVPRDRHTLVVWLLALLGVGLLEVVAGGMRHIYAIRNRSATDARVRDAIFAHALRLDASYHDRVGPGELMSRASSDSEHVARMMDAIGHTIGYALTVVAVSIVMLVVDAKLALLVLLPLPFVSVVAWLYSRRYDERTRRLQEAWAGAATRRAARGRRGRHAPHLRDPQPLRNRRAGSRRDLRARAPSRRLLPRSRRPGRADEPRLLGFGARRPDDGRDRPHDRLRAHRRRRLDRDARRRREAGPARTAATPVRQRRRLAVLAALRRAHAAAARSLGWRCDAGRRVGQRHPRRQGPRRRGRALRSLSESQRRDCGASARCRAPGRRLQSGARGAAADRDRRSPLGRRQAGDVRRAQPRPVRGVQCLRRHARLAAPRARPAGVDPAEGARRQRADHGGARNRAPAA
ncbi:MAG: hypothetical protein E6G23_00045 [Actinobacteria bacterium]|nr:MAG: hypothetical protein E6G23_00045 [Actinomycetota bacterium]